ncbi:uncharacterized protein LOC136071871 isoform X2 [Hydra vulgaris]
MSVNIGNVTKKIEVPFETLVSITLWDIPGREDIDLRRCYYKDVDAAIVVVDLSDKDSIKMAGTWKRDIYNNNYLTEKEGIKEQKKSMESQWKVPVLLLGNKFDKVSNGKEISAEEHLLEEISSEHGFVGCVAVSARESDGGVHSAVRSLIRYLLQQDNPKRVKRFHTKSSSLNVIFSDPSLQNKFVQRLGSVDDHTLEKLKICNISEVDNILRSCELKVHEVETIVVSFLIAVKNFKKSCCVAGVTDSSTCTIEQCISNLNDSIINDEKDSLKIVEEDSCMKIQVTLNPVGIPSALKRIFDIYNNEVSRYMQRIILEFPNHQLSLNDFRDQIIEQQKNLNSQNGFQIRISKNEIKYASSCLKENILRVNDTITLIEKSLKIATTCSNHIKNILV